MHTRQITRTCGCLLAAGIALLTGACSSSDGGAAVSTAPVPANAITIDAGNAQAVTQSAFTLADGIAATISALAIVSNGTQNCFDAGDYAATGTDDGSSYSSTLELSMCDEGEGVALSGTVNRSGTRNIGSGDYSDNITANLSGTTGAAGFSLTNLALTENGNDIDGSYQTTALRFSYAPDAGDGFAVNLVSAISGNDLSSSCPTSGSVEVSGAGNSVARITVAAGVVSVEVDSGSGFAAVAGSPFACNLYFN